jgi:diguanylate cyclase (GGDEF)-like protein
MESTAKSRRILVLDGSRVVRATLSKHLKDDFEILEESNGESAWQTLMLDSNVAAIISGIHPPKLEAHDLLARLRASSIRRLREVPFVLIVSDIENLAEREIDRSHGVAGFITKSMTKPAMVAALSALLNPTGSDKKPESRAKPPAAEAVATDKFMRSDKFRSVLSSLSFTESKAENVCALVFAIDNRDALIARFGDEIAGLIAERFAGLLVSKVNSLDLIGRCRGERLAIISYGVDLKQGVHFGQRVCKSLASGQIAIRGQKVKLTASVGVASTSDDKVATGSELFFLADQRLDQALVCGGNTVSTEYRPDCPLHCRDTKSVKRLLDALNAQGVADLQANAGALGLKMLPLMQLVDRELKLGLPLAEIRQKIEQRALAEVADA